MKLKKGTKILFCILTILSLIAFAGLYYYSHPPKINLEFEPIKVHDYPENTTFEKRLKHWQENCEFKKGNIYTGEEIQKILGKKNRHLFCFQNCDITNFSNTRTSQKGKLYQENYEYNLLKYFYVKGWISDAWYLTIKNDKPVYFTNDNNHQPNILFIGDSFKSNQNIQFNCYVSTTCFPFKYSKEYPDNK